MTNIGQIERITQNRVVSLFRKQLGYTYLGNWQDETRSSPIEEDLLRASLLKRGYSNGVIAKAIYEFKRAAEDQTHSLYERNKTVYDLLRYGVKVKPEVGEQHITVWLIAWGADNVHLNDFGVAEEVTVLGRYNKRPDIVLYVNGIALGVLELKRSVVSVAEGIRQNLDNQKKEFIQHFFSTMQFIMAGNDTEGLRYGAIETPEKYYMTWKEDGTEVNALDRALIQLCTSARLLELIHDFVVFDSGIKKLCRPNQYFGVKAAQAYVCRSEGGIIWHTQGSGKSLTMVWLAKWIRENISNSRVLIITDRTELDEQIENVFRGVSEDIYRTRSGTDLLNKLNGASPWLLCSLVHKFGARDDDSVSAYIAELQRSIGSDFSPKGNLVVFVDECHRTQSGVLHEAMKEVLPNALFIGFTGTPLLKEDKQRSIEVFGPYIHTYRYDEAVGDRVVLDLRYEARDIDQHISAPQRIDQWFEAKTRGLNDLALAQLKQKWGTMQKVLSSRSRLEMIVADILLDMETKPRLLSGRGNAILVSDSIYNACKLYELFTGRGFTQCAIVTSYSPSPNDLKGETTGEGLTERVEQYETYMRMLGTMNAETFEREAKRKFIEEPGQMRLLIVVDKLLTGFDAPSATYLYIDKQMRDHGLFQAICRVNRLDGDDKDYGYIIDYKDLFQSLEKSVQDYTSGAFDGYGAEDVEGLLTDRLAKGRERLEEAREQIKALCEAVQAPRDAQSYIRYFCAADTTDKSALKDNEPKRVALYKLTAALIRAYANIAGELEAAGYTTAEAEAIQREVEMYEKLRMEIKLASGDYIDLKLYEPAMRTLIDTYIRAHDSEKLSAFDDLTLVQLIVERGVDAIDALPESITAQPEAVAETIENNLRRLIIEEEPINPIYYEKMSTLLDALIQERKASALAYEEYLARIVAFTRQVKQPAQDSAYPRSLDSAAKRALFDNVQHNEEIALRLDEKIRAAKQDEWRGNPIKERRIMRAISEIVSGEAEIERIFKLVKAQPGY